MKKLQATGCEPFDLVFIDADKITYTEYYGDPVALVWYSLVGNWIEVLFNVTAYLLLYCGWMVTVKVRLMYRSFKEARQWKAAFAADERFPSH